MDLVSKTLGNYRIDRLLGEGGMGAVYQAYDLSLQRDVAVKLIHPHFARQPNFRERFLQEARVMARLDHPGIVKVHTINVEGELVYIVMEYIAGGNLRQLLDRLIQQRNWLPLDEAISLVQQLCRILDYAHQHKVLHRDIKPANLMLKAEPADGLPFRLVLTDLGLAKLLEEQGLTLEGTSMGTPAYMSPEQALGEATDPRSDVYSLGILLYELAVGRLPFPIRTITEAMRYHTKEQPPAPRSLRPDLPEAVERVIMKALEKDPGNRYPSAAELGTALAGVNTPATEIYAPDGGQSISLTSVYEKSLIAPAKPGEISLMTVLDSGSTAPRGVSVFEGQFVPPGAQARIQVVYKDNTPQALTLPPGTVTIGRDKDNHIVLSDTKASRKHAQITWNGREYRVMDLNSTNGTILENTRLLPGVSEVWMPNQALRIGDTWLRLILPVMVSQTTRGMGSTLSGSLFTGSGAGLVGVSINPQQLKVKPGGSVTASFSLLNQSPIVDHFSLSLTGIPTDWIASFPSALQLMPSEQKEAVFTLSIPRSPQSRAGPHSMTLRVTSHRDPSQFVEVKLTLMIAAYSQFRAELQPQHLRAGRAGRLIVTNQGNSEETFIIRFKDAADELNFQPQQLQLRVPGGNFAVAEYHVQAPNRWIGGEQSYSFSAQVTSPSEETQTLQADLLSRGLISPWVPATIIPLCVFVSGIILYLLWPRGGQAMPLPGTPTVTKAPESSPTIFPMPATPVLTQIIFSPTSITPSPTSITPSLTPTASATATTTPTNSPPPTNPVLTATPVLPNLQGILLFESNRDGNPEIYAWNLGNQTFLRVTNNAATDVQPALAPDGLRVAYVSNQNGNNEIFITGLDRRASVNVTNNPADDQQPAWSPDGQWIAFTSNRDGNQEIYMMRSDGTEVRNLTGNAGNDFSPSWYSVSRLLGSEDWIAFTSTRDGNLEIYKVRPNGTGLDNLTRNPANDYSSSGNTNGLLLTFVTDRDGNPEIYTMTESGGAPRRITTNNAQDLDPNLGPNEEWIAFTTDRDGNLEIYTIPVEGGAPYNLTRNPSQDRQPNW